MKLKDAAAAPVYQKLPLPEDIARLLANCPKVDFVETIEQLAALSCGDEATDRYEVRYKLPDGRDMLEATVMRVKNGLLANYPEPYMRRRDPACMVIADTMPTDKAHYDDRYGESFDRVRGETLAWLASQELVAFVFQTGRLGIGNYVVAVVPRNAAFFAAGLAMLQGIMTIDALPADMHIDAAIYVAPPFRHTHFDGKQVVVHRRDEHFHEMFAYNLYPGPSAKKGVYGMLIGQGEREGWVTAHCSTVQVFTPYDNVITLMHEGASGGGKSEMLQQPHRQPEGDLLLGTNIETGEHRYLEIPRTCRLHPVVDDMALCHPDHQVADSGKLRVTDAENAWFVRVDHIKEYGTDLDLEKMTAQPKQPLLFLNIDCVPRGRAMIWEHIEDEPGKPCPNPRVIVPRAIVPDIVDHPVSVDIRSLGIRTPPCTRKDPTYGIIGLFHILPPALAWLWRLVAPRGHANPSIVGGDGMKSEGVGSYWPFATGKQVAQANLLLKQIEKTTRTQFVLIPNQHIGAWKTGFMPQWVAREYLARRGTARFNAGQIHPARCALLGYALYSMRVEGMNIPRWFLQVETQPEVGKSGYDQGAGILEKFFRDNLQQFLTRELAPLGRWIIECFMDGGSVEDYEQLLPSAYGRERE